MIKGGRWGKEMADMVLSGDDTTSLVGRHMDDDTAVTGFLAFT